MQIHNIAGYKFIFLTELPALRGQLLELCQELALKGTVLLSSEGININLAGLSESIVTFKKYVQKDPRFQDMTFRDSYSDSHPFRYMKVKIKKEIITLRVDEVRPEQNARPPHVTPEEFKRWLEEGRDITVLDTRNDYEIRFGTFRKAVNLNIHDFSEFPQATESIPREKPIVMFCTGGIRCEKAALHLINAGFPEIYQLDGGILNYFAKVGGDHYEGECFVFDQRIALDPDLKTTGTLQCVSCEGPMKSNYCDQCTTY